MGDYNGAFRWAYNSITNADNVSLTIIFFSMYLVLLTYRKYRSSMDKKVEIKRDKAEFIDEFYKSSEYVGEPNPNPENPEYHRLLAAYAQYFGSPLSLKEILFFQKTSNPILFTEWYCDTKFAFDFIDKPVLKKRFTYWWAKGIVLWWPIVSFLTAILILLIADLVTVVDVNDKSQSITVTVSIIFLFLTWIFLYTLMLKVDSDSTLARNLAKRLENEMPAFNTSKDDQSNEAKSDIK